MGNAQKTAVRNVFAVQGVTSRMRASARNRDYSDYDASFKAYSEDVREKLASLLPKQKRALELIKNSKEKLKSGGADEKTVGEHTYSAEVFASLYTLLSNTYRKAVDAKDVHVLSRVFIAAGTLSTLDVEQKHEGQYPSDATLRETLVQGALTRSRRHAERVFTDVIRDLDGTHRKLNIEEPQLPLH